MDGDGQTTCSGDCDDTDATLNGTDADDDGLSSCEGDCDDTDAGKGDSAQDADCDGVKTDEDCDDTDGLLGTCWTTLSLSGTNTVVRYAPLVKPIVGGIMVQDNQTYPSTGSVPLAPVTTTPVASTPQAHSGAGVPTVKVNPVLRKGCITRFP